MRNPWKVLAVFLASVLAAAGAHAAGALKLKPIVSGYVDGKGAGLRQPEGVGYDGKSLVVVADTGNGRLVEYSLHGESLTPGADISIPQLPYPIRVQVAPNGEILALDGKLRKIARLSPSGEFRGYVEPSGVPGDRPVVPRSFRVGPEGNLYVLDVLSGRVLQLDPSGKFLRGIPFPEGYGFLSDLDVDTGGNLYLVDSVGRKVFTAPKDNAVVVPLTGGLGEDLDFPTSIALDERGDILLADENGSGIVVIGRDGSYRGRQLAMGWKEGMLRYPSQICAARDGNVIVADRGNNRIQVFRIVR